MLTCAKSMTSNAYKGTHPAGSMWTRNPIPSYGAGPQVNSNGTQFPLPTFHGKTAKSPTSLAGFCPCRSGPNTKNDLKNSSGGGGGGSGGSNVFDNRFSPLSSSRNSGSGDGSSRTGGIINNAGGRNVERWLADTAAAGTFAAAAEGVATGDQTSCYCCCGCCNHENSLGNPSFDEWVLVDQLQIPTELPLGEWILGFRWDCEQTPQVWQQCASINVVAPPSNPTPAAPPTLAPLCGDAAHGCCLQQGGEGGNCSVWSAVNTCVQSKDHCEGGTPKHFRENSIVGCNGVWMPQSTAASAKRCVNSNNKHVCGYNCTGSGAIYNGEGVGSSRDGGGGGDISVSSERQCESYAALGHEECVESEEGCKRCQGTWLAVPPQR